MSIQRMKGQGSQATNGPKEHVNDHEDFESWRTQPHHPQQQGYSTPISTSMGTSDPYYYSTTSFPYQTFGVNDGTWSNGGDQMTFLGGYGGQMAAAAAHEPYGIDGMFGTGGFGTFNQQAAGAFNYFPGSGATDYSTWGGGAGGAGLGRNKHYEDYYRAASDASGGGYIPQQQAQQQGDDRVKAVEQGMQGLGLSDKDKDKDLKDGQPLPGGTNKKLTWASVASTPAKPTPQVKKKAGGLLPPPMLQTKHNMDIGTWEAKNGGAALKPVAPPSAQPRASWATQPVNMRGRAPQLGPPQQQQYPPVAPGMTVAPPVLHHPMHPPQPDFCSMAQPPPPLPQLQSQIPSPLAPSVPAPSHPILDELREKNNYNPTDYDLSAKGARFFVIKSYSEDDIHRSIKYEIWCSTEHGNKRLDAAFREREAAKGSVLLFFSVNGSGHFCGMALMTSPVDYHASSSVWSQDKWKGQFRVRWVYVKDVPNVQLRHIRLENNEGKPVTNSRDTQEVPFEKGRLVLKIMHQYRHSTSIFDDFSHYEKRQEEEDFRKNQQQHQPQPPSKERGDGGGRGRGRGGPSRN
ncbi:Hypothetical predicted protein [Cloeon dipterum]|uniref:YTH domain-containing protein n=1 Tax=Cloeon dipterum TaxID=197152 RepID=A0A8S1E135_9INSE|nr:Hypothetical predicted protein [Cloeon dipterum]